MAHDHFCSNTGCGRRIGRCATGDPDHCSFPDDVWCETCLEEHCDVCGCSPCIDPARCVTYRYDGDDEEAA